MSQPVVVSIPNRHGKDEAIRRLKAGLGSVQSDYSHLLAVQEETWNGDTLHFRVSALGQQAAGEIAVAEDRVVITVSLPWLLSKFAQAVQGAVKQQATMLLEKK